MWSGISLSFYLHFLKVSDVEYLFMCLLTICISSKKCLCSHFIWTVLLLLLLLSFKNSLFFLDSRPILDLWLANYFLLFCRLPLHFLDDVLWFLGIWPFIHQNHIKDLSWIALFASTFWLNTDFFLHYLTSEMTSPFLGDLQKNVASSLLCNTALI